MLLGLTLTLSAHEPEDADTAQWAPFQQSYLTLQEKLQKLEADPTVYEKALSTGAVIILDLAAELAHSWFMVGYSPEYFYQHSDPARLPGFQNSTLQDIIFYTIGNKYSSLILSGVFSWLSNYGAAIPSIPGASTLQHTGIMAGIAAGSYGYLLSNMFYQGRQKNWNNEISALAEQDIILRDMSRIAKDERGAEWYMAVRQLDSHQARLHAASMTIMVCWNIMRRFNHKAEMKDVRNTLKLARERLQKQNHLTLEERLKNKISSPTAMLEESEEIADTSDEEVPATLIPVAPEDAESLATLAHPNH